MSSVGGGGIAHKPEECGPVDGVWHPIDGAGTARRSTCTVPEGQEIRP